LLRRLLGKLMLDKSPFSAGCKKLDIWTPIGDTTGSVAGVPAAVLAEVGCRALRAMNGRRTIVIGEGAGQGPRPVIMLVADFVRQ